MCRRDREIELCFRMLCSQAQVSVKWIESQGRQGVLGTICLRIELKVSKADTCSIHSCTCFLKNNCVVGDSRNWIWVLQISKTQDPCLAKSRRREMEALVLSFLHWFVPSLEELACCANIQKASHTAFFVLQL